MGRNTRRGRPGPQENTSSPGRPTTGRHSANPSTGGSPTTTDVETSSEQLTTSRPDTTRTTSAWGSSSTSSSNATCSVEGCVDVVKSKGLCSRHYQRQRKTGDPEGIRAARWAGYERPQCEVAGCCAPAHARGLCAAHVKRQERHGDPTAGRRPPAVGTTTADRLATLVTRRGDDECWPWNAATLPSGYGQLCFQGRRLYAHVAAYEIAKGPVPTGLVIDHRCHNEDLSCAGGARCPHRKCCNPAHLEAVTSATNSHRARVRSNEWSPT
jgi:hypothetical protein